MGNDSKLAQAAATAILGIDTLWGGDVMNPSGAGRFIADSWFSDRKPPTAYTHPAAARLRAIGGVTGNEPAGKAVDNYLAAVDVAAAVREVRAQGRSLGGLRGAYLEGLCMSLEVMWDLAQEMLGRGAPVPYERCVLACTGREPEPSRPEEKRRRVAELLSAAGYRAETPESLLAAADAWRRDRLVPRKALRQLADAFIAQMEAGAVRHVAPHLPKALRSVLRPNIRFLPIDNIWFSGSMNYLGRARNRDGSPQFEATYEINAALEISVPEFAQLVSHEVVPGHLTSFALVQALYGQGRLGFESTVLTMNTRAATLFEGIANNAILLAHGVKEVAELPDPDLQIGILLSLLQDDAKNQSSWLTWRERRPQAEVARTLREEYLCSAERADKLSGGWGRHPLHGRMSLPVYRAGTEKVAELRRRYPAERVVPALYNVYGLVDVVTIDQTLEAKPRGTARASAAPGEVRARSRRPGARARASRRAR